MLRQSEMASCLAAEAHALKPMLAPRSVALVGASRKRNTVGNDMIRNIIASSFDGAVYPVNPSYDQLYGYPCLASLSDLPEPVDLAILSVPNRVLERVVAEAIAVGARSLVIFASAELDGDPALRDRIASMARAAQVPICGANCMGFFNPRHPIRAFSAFHPEPLDVGGLTLIAQSGSLLQALLFNDERLKFNLAVSTGQELVTTAADFMDYALDQPETRCIAVILEAIRDPQRFVAALQKARNLAIPVIVLKLGRTEAGAHFALSHTGAIAGNAEVYEALFRRFGVISVRDLSELAATAILLSTIRKPLAPGGLSAILDSGGERELIVDVASDHDVPFAKISEATTRILSETLDPGLTPVNPVDAWGTGRDFEGVFETCLTALMRDPDTGLGMFVADLAEELDLHAAYVDVCLAVARASDKPLVVMTNYSAWSHRKHAVRLARAGIPVLDGTVSSLRAVRHAMNWRDFMMRPAVAGLPGAENPRAAHWRAVLAGRQEPLSEDEGYTLLNDYGIAVPRHRIVTSRETALTAATEIGLPVVLKTAAPGILHKSDVGGVRLNLRTPEAVLEAYDAVCAKLGERVLICEMARGQVEMALGLVRDAAFGSFVMIAIGGIWIEILKDSQLAMVPLDHDVAARRIAALKMSPVLDGVRGAAPCDRAALIDAVVRLGALASDLGDLIGELDINPVLVGENGITALDSLIVPLAKGTQHDH